jgi:hypothetical protein
MRELRRQSRVTDAPARQGVPAYLIYFGIPPFLAAFVVSAVDPMAGLVLVACLIIMVITVNIVLRVSRKQGLRGTKG